jgi:hypothetical protein
MPDADRRRAHIDPPDPPVDPDIHQVHIKMKEGTDADPSKVQDFLTDLAQKLNTSEDTYITADPDNPLYIDADGAGWAKGTMVVPMNLGCGTKHPDDGDRRWDDEDDGED